MCQVTAPPGLFLASPLQAPNDWLTVTGILVFLTAMAVLTYWRLLRPLTSGAGRNVGVALLACWMLASMTGIAIGSLVVGPTDDAVMTWKDIQLHNLLLHNCPNQKWMRCSTPWAACWT
jgi:hypothetical protein